MSSVCRVVRSKALEVWFFIIRTRCSTGGGNSRNDRVLWWDKPLLPSWGEGGAQRRMRGRDTQSGRPQQASKPLTRPVGAPSPQKGRGGFLRPPWGEDARRADEGYLSASRRSSQTTASQQTPYRRNNPPQTSRSRPSRPLRCPHGGDGMPPVIRRRRYWQIHPARPALLLR